MLLRTLILLLGFCLSAVAAGPPAQHRIVFLGDSITQAGGYVEIITAALIAEHPETDWQVIPLGLSSETVSGLSEEGHAGGKFPRPDLHERLDRVLAKARPELVVACYGMNDGIYYPPGDSRTKAFREGMVRLHDKVTASGAKIIHLTPPVFDPQPIRDRVLPDGLEAYPQPWQGYDEVLGLYSEWLLGMREQGWEVLDIHGGMKTALEERRRKDPDFVLAKDGVHPGAGGHLLMARPVLEAWGLRVKADGTPDAPHGAEILTLVRKAQGILRPAWLSAVGHRRPGIQDGLPLAEAEEKADVLLGEARGLARSAVK